MIQTMSPSRQPLSREAAAEVEITIKYAGYIRRQESGVERLRHLEKARLPHNLDYTAVAGLSREVREKLSTIQPTSLGQAARIPGVTPAALSLLAIHLKRSGAA
jgi:tRNA uridine 5-carboxymethylaminomethyl modification enzyme